MVSPVLPGTIRELFAAIDWGYVQMLVINFLNQWGRLIGVIKSKM